MRCMVRWVWAELARPRAAEKAKAAIAEVLASHQGPNGVMLPGACWLVSAGKG